MEQFATIKDAARYLESKLTDPDAWKMGTHTFFLKERPQIELWTANGVWFFGLNQGFENTYIFGWRKFWCYFKFWWYVMRPLRKAAAIKLLNEQEHNLLKKFNKES